jgi:FtsP/CotA-like multicopper oxidase with cupredoxin domain
LRLINSSAEGLQHFTIDNHNFTVIWLDFVPIEPFKTSMISLSPGQRANIIVHANGEPTDVVWMRSDIDSVCAAPNNPHTRAIILYESADTTSIPTTSATPYNATDCVTQDLNSTTPTYGLALSNSVPKRIDLNFTLGYNGTGFLQWYTSNQTFRADMSQSLLARAAAGDFTFKTENPLWNVYDIGSNGTVRVLMRNYHISPHPMHLHGHDFWVLAEGRGEWDGSIINAGNPMRRDTHQLLPMRNNVPGFAVIEWTLDNPGIWAFHCHIFSHSSLGFYLNVLEASQDIVGRDVPDDVKQSCTSWNAFTAKTFVDQPDAGI